MDFRLNEEDTALVEGVREFLAGTYSPETLRARDGAEGADTPTLWPQFADLGLTGLLVPETYGGLGRSLVEGALIAVELGRAAVAEPIVDTALVAAPWLAANGATEQLAAIAAGDVKVALAHAVNPWIADLDQADFVLSDKLLARNSATPIRVASVDPLRRLYAPEGTQTTDERLLDLGALMAAAQLIGLADAMLAIATEYAKTRQQFGQPIGAFQAVKHHLANVAVAVEFAKPVLPRAADALDTGASSASIHVSHAKLAAGDAALAAAETAIQVHGAMGYTYEVDLHFWMKRAWALGGAWGDRAFHLRRIDDAVIGGTLPVGPSHTFA